MTMAPRRLLGPFFPLFMLCCAILLSCRSSGSHDSPPPNPPTEGPIHFDLAGSSWALPLTPNCYFRLDFYGNETYEILNDCVGVMTSDGDFIELTDESVDSVRVIASQAWRGAFKTSGSVLAMATAATSCKMPGELPNISGAYFTVEGEKLRLSAPDLFDFTMSKIKSRADSEIDPNKPYAKRAVVDGTVVFSGCLSSFDAKGTRSFMFSE